MSSANKEENNDNSIEVLLSLSFYVISSKESGKRLGKMDIRWIVAQLARNVEYTDCTSAESQDSQRRILDMPLNNLMVRLL